MALRCAVELGVADAIHRRGGAASLDDLLAELSLDASRLPCLRAVMRALAAAGVFAEGGSDVEYRLTAVSSLLVDDGSDRGSLAPATLLFVAPPFVTPVVNLTEWVLAGAGAGDGNSSGNSGAAAATAFEMAHGGDIWGVLGRDAALGGFFNDALASDTRFVMDMAIRGSAAKVLEGILSLVDVAGGAGAAARAVAAAFRGVRCTVLDLPQVIDAVGDPGDGLVEYVAGDMMEFIPPADAVLLKTVSYATDVLHDWSDQDCVNILKRCKEAICLKDARGKVIVIDIVLGSSPHAICSQTQLWLDLLMLTITTRKERTEKEWSRLFKEAGFSQYKTRPALGHLSIIEVFP
ncbi:unnamed protein product [Urochloa decumbens]|uniref:Uncharacterized protein n=1 Tax=Urochloa decumbens TaxID=240449 RepID=A0ABC9EZ31_9POAL